MHGCSWAPMEVRGNVVSGRDMRGLISREEPEPPEGGELQVLRESRGGRGEEEGCQERGRCRTPRVSSFAFSNHQR